MKIIIIAPYFFPKHGGGENYAYQIALNLKRLGNDVAIITTRQIGKTEKIDTQSGIKIYRLPVMFNILNTPVNIFWSKAVAAIIRAEQPDIINAHLTVPLMIDIAERVRGSVPFVLTYHNDIIKEKFFWNILANLAYKLFINKTLRNADALIATSQHYVNNSFHLKQVKKTIDIVAPGVDLKIFNQNSDVSWLKKEYGNRYTILFVAQLDKTHAHKGLSILISATAQLKTRGYNTQLIVAGTGNYIEKYKEQARREKINEIKFVGYVSDKILAKYYSGADVLVLPSTTSAEGFGMVLLEANACGIPVIGSNIGGIPEAIKNRQTGLLVEPKNIEALATAIALLYNEPKLAKQMGLAGAALVKEEYGWDKQVYKTEVIFKRVIQEKI